MNYNKAKKFLKRTCSDESLSIFDIFFDFLGISESLEILLKVESSIKKHKDGRESKNRYCFTLSTDFAQTVDFFRILASKDKISGELCSENGELYKFIKKYAFKDGVMAVGVDYSDRNNKIIKFYFEDGGGTFGEAIVITNKSKVSYKKYNLIYNEDYGKLIDSFCSIGISKREIFKTAAVYGGDGSVKELHFILRNKKNYDEESYLRIITVKNESITYYLIPKYV
jgi:hypothetical protein